LKKVTQILLAVSTLGLLTSIVLFAMGGSFFFTLDLLAFSSFCVSVFFPLIVIQKQNPKLSSLTFYGGLILILLFTYLIINPEKFSSFWPFELSGLLLLITLGIVQLLKGRFDLISKISRSSFWIAAISFIFLLITNQSSPLYFTIISSLLFIGTISLIISILKKNEVAEIQ
jgi:hypothetical protein